MPIAVGAQGDCFARIVAAEAYPEINNQRFPRIWNAWLPDGVNFRDWGYERGRRQWPNVVQALRQTRIAILAEHQIQGDIWHHGHYIAVVRVSSVDDSDGTLRLIVGDTICNLDN